MNNMFSGRSQDHMIWKLVLEAVSRDNVLPLTSTCNLDCLFCSHYQNPPGVKAYFFSPLETTLLDQVIPFLNPERKIVIGESTTRLCEGEPLTHPHFFEVLEKIRRCFPGTSVQVTTNGSFLDNKAVEKLAALSGVGRLEVVVSLNSSSIPARKVIMRDEYPGRAVEGILLCQEKGLLFHGSIVALPHLLGWEDLHDTLFFLDKAGSLSTRVFLPGFTCLAPSELHFNISLWGELRIFLEKMQERLQHPVIPEPSFKKDLLARVEGVIGDTPAQKAGLKKGDVVEAVNGKTPVSAVDAFHIIKKTAFPVLKIKRSNEENTFELELEKQKGTSPGAVFFHDLDPAYIDIIEKKAETPGSSGFSLMLTSEAARPLFDALLRRGVLPERLLVRAVKNRFFGGSIVSAGLLVLSDLEYELGKVLETEMPHNVILPPALFDRRGFDLLGRHYRELYYSFPQLSFSLP